MDSTTHPFDREEVMAYLDGELAPERASAAAAHLEQCAECRALAAELRSVSRQMAEWPVEMIPARVGDNVLRAVAAPKGGKSAAPQKKQPARQTPHWMRWLTWSGASAVAALLVMALGVYQFSRKAGPSERAISSPGADSERGRADVPVVASNGREPTTAAPAPLASAPANKPDSRRAAEARQLNELAKSALAQAQKDGARDSLHAAGAVALDRKEKQASEQGPMIIRRASMAVLTKEFDAARASLENLVKAHQGYFGQLDVVTPPGAGRGIAATLRVPAAQLDAVLIELRKLGQVQQENQTADDITNQYVDLTARLSNARETEKRLMEILRERTGKVGDVLQVEQEIARTREQIEQMDAQRKSLDNQVQYAAVDLSITEEFKKSLEAPPPALSLGTRVNNAAVSGLRDAADTLVGILLWLLAAGPSLLLWSAFLAWPVFKGIRWLRRLLSQHMPTAA